MSDSSSHPDTTDLDRMHSAARREKADMAPAKAPAPMWIMFLGFIVAVVGGGQLGHLTGGFRFESSNPYAGVLAPDPRPMGDGAAVAMGPFEKAMKGGAGSYAVCGGCHQGNGGGLPGQFPPLAGSDWVKGGTERLVRIVLNGLAGPVTVSGQNFNNVMPGQGAMSDQDLANALTYIRNTWGNEGTMVTKEMVAKVREELGSRMTPWSEAELAEFADKNCPGEIPDGPGATVTAEAPAEAK